MKSIHPREDPLEAYFDAIKDAPVPPRLLAETPPEAFARKLFFNLAWATVGLALVLLASSLPTTPDPDAAARTARLIAVRGDTR